MVFTLLILINFTSGDFGFDNTAVPSLRISDDLGNVTYNQNITNNYYTINQSINLTDYSNIVLSNQSNSLNGFQLTDVGKLVMSGAISSQNILPSQNRTYSLGNETDWFLKIYVENINAMDITTTNLNSIDIGSTRIDSTNITTKYLDGDEIQSDEVNITNNLTVGGTKISVIDNVTYYKSVN